MNTRLSQWQRNPTEERLFACLQCENRFFSFFGGGKYQMVTARNRSKGIELKFAR